MNILCLDQFSSLGGGQRCLLDLLPALANRGWQVRVAVPGEGPFCTAVRKLGLPIDVLRHSSYTNGRKSFGAFTKFALDLQRLARAIRRLTITHSIDLLYVNGTRLLPAAALVGRCRSIPVILHCHNRLLEPSTISLMGYSMRFTGAHLIACCNSTAEPMRRYMQSERVSVVYNGIPGFRQRALSPTPPRRIGIIGRIERDKGQLEFIIAARAIFRHFPEVTFCVIGAPLFTTSDYLDEVIAASQDLPVEFAGWHDDIGAVLSNVDLLVVPSTQIDSTPRVILEAFSAGVPVVAFPSGGIPEILTDCETGFLTIASTPEALAERIGFVWNMPQAQLTSVIGQARQSWQDNFTLERYQEQVSDIVDQVLTGANPKPARALKDRRHKRAEMMRDAGKDETAVR